MTKESKISGRETYVLDDEELKALEDVSLTGVMRDVTESIKKLELEEQKKSAETDDDDDMFGSLRIDD